MSSRRGNLGRLLSKHKKRLLPDDTLYPSSSTETESGYFDHQMPASSSLTPTQQPSLRASTSNDLKWVRSFVPSDYTSRIPPPETRNWFLASLTSHSTVDPQSEWVPLPDPSVGLAEWSHVDARFGDYWSSLLIVAIAWIIRFLLSVILLLLSATLLDIQWEGAERFSMQIDRYVKDFAKWQKVKPMPYRAGQEVRGPHYCHGQVLLLSRDMVCLRVDKSFIEEHAPALLNMPHYRSIGLLYSQCLHVVDLDHSSGKIRSFLDFLHGHTFDEIWTASEFEDAFSLRTSLYLMARQYASSKTYKLKGSIFHFREWNSRGTIHPMHIFAVACRASDTDRSLARDAILNLAKLESTRDSLGNPRNWMSWFTEGISLDAMDAGDFARKMRPRCLDAYVAAHQETCAFIRKTAERRNNGIDYLNAQGRTAALNILAVEFLKALDRGSDGVFARSQGL